MTENEGATASFRFPSFFYNYYSSPLITNLFSRNVRK